MATSFRCPIAQIYDVVMAVKEFITEQSDIESQGWHQVNHDVTRSSGIYYVPGADLPLPIGTRVIEDGVPGIYRGNGEIDFVQ